MARFWTGPLTWALTPTLHWRMPTGTLGMVDLRSLPDQGLVGPTPHGLALFVTANSTNLGGDYTLLGQAPRPDGLTLTPADRTAWRTAFGLPNPLGPGTLADALWETLTVQADPTGVDRPMPIDCGIDGRLELHLAGALVRSQPFRAADPEATPLIDMVQRTYRRYRQACLDGIHPPTHYRKLLGSWVAKYRVPYRQLQPSDLPDEPPLPPETTLTESFNKADSSTLGPVQTWTEFGDFAATNSWEVVSNRARVIAASTTLSLVGESARAEAALSGSAHYAQIDIVTLTNGAANEQLGPACRFSASVVELYCSRLLSLISEYQILKFVGGVASQIGASFSVTPSPPDVARVQADGSTIKAFLEGVERISVTDTAITGNTRCGMFGYSSTGTGAEADSWIASDLGIAFKPYYDRGGRYRSVASRGGYL